MVISTSRARLVDLSDRAPDTAERFAYAKRIARDYNLGPTDPAWDQLAALVAAQEDRLDAATKELRAEAVREIEAFIGRLTTQTAEPAKAGAK